MADLTWKPIDSAPRDGTRFDVWVQPDRRGYRVTDCWFREDGMLMHSGGVAYKRPTWPTHYMGRPRPPEEK